MLKKKIARLEERGKKILENSWIRTYLIGVAVTLTVNLMSNLVKTIPSSNKLILDLLNQTVAHHLPATEIWETLLGIAAWIISTFIFTLAVLIAWTVFKKFTNILNPGSAEPPPYEGYTGQFCLKSGVYQARINPDYEVEVLSGQMFPLAVTKHNQLVPTAWTLVRGIKDNHSN